MTGSACEQASADLSEACDGAVQTISRKLISLAADTEEANLERSLTTDAQAAESMRGELAKLTGDTGTVTASSATRQRIADILEPGEQSPYTGARTLGADEQEAKDAADAAAAADASGRPPRHAAVHPR